MLSKCGGGILWTIIPNQNIGNSVAGESWLEVSYDVWCSSGWESCNFKKSWVVINHDKVVHLKEICSNLFPRTTGKEGWYQGSACCTLGLLHMRHFSTLDWISSRPPHQLFSSTWLPADAQSVACLEFLDVQSVAGLEFLAEVKKVWLVDNLLVGALCWCWDLSIML